MKGGSFDDYNEIQALKDLTASVELQRKISKDLLDCIKLLSERIEKLEEKHDTRDTTYRRD